MEKTLCKEKQFLSVFFHIRDTISPARICYLYFNTKGTNHICYLKPASSNIDELFLLCICYPRLYFFFLVEYSLLLGCSSIAQHKSSARISGNI